MIVDVTIPVEINDSGFKKDADNASFCEICIFICNVNVSCVNP